MIHLTVPATLEYRDVAMRVVTAASKLFHPDADRDAATDEFDAQVISAFGEAFNNIAIHGYRNAHPGTVQIEIEVQPDALRIRILDDGNGFDPESVGDPDLDELPEQGMGLYIIRSFMDEVRYAAGAPNVLEMVKRWRAHGEPEEVRHGPSPKRRRSGGRMARWPAGRASRCGPAGTAMRGRVAAASRDRYAGTS